MHSGTRQTITEYVESVQYQYNGVRKNLCDEISNEIATRLEEDFGWTVYSPVFAPVDGAKHFVAVIVWKDIQPSDSVDYYVLDATRTQFDGETEDLVFHPLDHPDIQDFYDEIRLSEFGESQ